MTNEIMNACLYTHTGSEYVVVPVGDGRFYFLEDGYLTHVILYFRWVTMHEQIMLILINLAVPLVPPTSHVSR